MLKTIIVIAFLVATGRSWYSGGGNVETNTNVETKTYTHDDSACRTELQEKRETAKSLRRKIEKVESSGAEWEHRYNEVQSTCDNKMENAKNDFESKYENKHSEVKRMYERIEKCRGELKDSSQTHQKKLRSRQHEWESKIQNEQRKYSEHKQKASECSKSYERKHEESENMVERSRKCNDGIRNFEHEKREMHKLSSAWKKGDNNQESHVNVVRERNKWTERLETLNEKQQQAELLFSEDKRACSKRINDVKQVIESIKEAIKTYEKSEKSEKKKTASSSHMESFTQSKNEGGSTGGGWYR